MGRRPGRAGPAARSPLTVRQLSPPSSLMRRPPGPDARYPAPARRRTCCTNAVSASAGHTAGSAPLRRPCLRRYPGRWIRAAVALARVRPRSGRSRGAWLGGVRPPAVGTDLHRLPHLDRLAHPGPPLDRPDRGGPRLLTGSRGGAGQRHGHPRSGPQSGGHPGPGGGGVRDDRGTRRHASRAGGHAWAGAGRHRRTAQPARAVAQLHRGRGGLPDN